MWWLRLLVLTSAAMQAASRPSLMRSCAFIRTTSASPLLLKRTVARAHASGAHSLLSGLNPTQHEIVTAPLRNIRVIAGPGSGKTRVLTHRIVQLVEQHQVPPWQILAVTFTNKAAEEMRHRIQGLIGEESARKISIGTFHAFCSRVLRDFHTEWKILRNSTMTKNFAIADSSACYKYIQNIIAEKGYKETTDVTASRMQELVSLINRENLTDDIVDHPELRMACEVNRDYQQWLSDNNLMDFDNLVSFTRDLLSKHPKTLERLRWKLRHVLVDEWQDTDRSQYSIVKLLGGAPTEIELSRQAAKEDEAPYVRSTFVVGDAAQTIYSWRGANSQSMMDFDRDFNKVMTYRLGENYRSVQDIVSASQAVIGRNVPIKKEAATKADSDEPVTIVKTKDDVSQAKFIAEMTKRFIDKQGVTPNEIAIMYRSHSQSPAIEAELLKSGIPFTVVGSFAFKDRREVKDILCYLRVLCNPADADSLRRVINIPSRGIGNKTQTLLLESCKAIGVTPLEGLLQLASDSTNSTLLDEMKIKKSSKQFKSLNAVADLFQSLGRQRDNALSVAELLEITTLKTNYSDYLRISSETAEEADGRVENVQKLVDIARKFDSDKEQLAPAVAAATGMHLMENEDNAPQTGLEYLAEFMETFGLMMNRAESLANANNATTSRVNLMTVHASKGLEFDVVFVSGLEEGTLPVYDGGLEELVQTRTPNVAGVRYDLKKSVHLSIAEERRVLYVAMTRARNRLILSYRAIVPARAIAKKFKNKKQFKDIKMKPSRFLEELPSSINHVAA